MLPYLSCYFLISNCCCLQSQDVTRCLVLYLAYSPMGFLTIAFFTLVLTFGHLGDQKCTRWNFGINCSVNQNGHRNIGTRGGDAGSWNVAWILPCIIWTCIPKIISLAFFVWSEFIHFYIFLKILSVNYGRMKKARDAKFYMHIPSDLTYIKTCS